MLKVCPKCKIEKDGKEFYFHGAARDHLSYFCKLCHRKRVRVRADEIKRAT